METRIFGRLTAWQNWIFIRPNASGAEGALRRYGTGRKADFDRSGCDAMTSHARRSTSTRRSRTTSTSRATASSSAPSSAGSRTSSTGGATMGPAVATKDVYLRTAVDVGREGWAHFDHVAMDEYRWGVFLAERDTDRKIAFGEQKGEPVWQQVPGEYRADLQRLIVIQGDTEPASVEQQRLPRRDRAVALRPAQPVPGQRRGGPSPLGDGLPAARLLRTGRARGGRGSCWQRNSGDRTTRRASSAPSTRRRPDWLSFYMFTYFTDRDGKYQLGTLKESAFDPLSPHLRVHAQGGGPPHVRRHHGRRPRGDPHRAS